MTYVILNVGSGDYHSGTRFSGPNNYETERGAKGACTKLNKQYGNTVQWEVVTHEEYVRRVSAKPVKMVERINLMSGLPYMEAEDTPYFCSPSSETYWSR